MFCKCNFYPRSPCGERLSILLRDLCLSTFLSTLSLRRATILYTPQEEFEIDISIHALLAESDRSRRWRPSPPSNFYPRSPCGERRSPELASAKAALFLSTLSLRRATPRCRQHSRARRFLSTLSLRRATISGLRHKCAIFYFYPRSPCGERLLSILIIGFSGRVFLSTLSLRRATPVIAEMTEDQSISIHALLAESDSWTEAIAAKIGHFYPRSPCGERPRSWRLRPKTRYFYPRSPCGERRLSIAFKVIICLFLSTLSLRRATKKP